MFVRGQINNGNNASSGLSGSPVSKPNLDAWPAICAQWTEHLDHVAHLARIHSHQQVDHEPVRIHLEAVDGDRDHSF